MLVLLTTNTLFAQKAMNPVSFKLKNGLNVLIAQNDGSGNLRKINCRKFN